MQRSPLAVLVFAAAFLAFQLVSSPAFAQGTLDVLRSDQPSEVEAILKEAGDGATVVIVRPREERPVVATSSPMRAQRFLDVRRRLQEIGRSAETLLPAMRQTIENVSRAQTIEGAGGMVPAIGRYAWAWWALATVAIGLVIAYFVIRPIRKWTARHFGHLAQRVPSNGADISRVLLMRVAIALGFSVLHFSIIIAVAVVDDTGFEPTRRLIFEIALAWFVYRVMRYAVAWNLTAYDAPHFRLFNFDDAQARRAHDGWWQGAALVLVFGVVVAWFVQIGRDPRYGALSADHEALLFMALIAFAIVVLAVYIVLNRRAIVQGFTPRGPNAFALKARTILAGALPVLAVLYGVFAFAAFVYRLALGEPAPAAAIVAPFVIAYLALIVVGVVLVVIDAIFRRRRRTYNERARERVHMDRRRREAEMRALAERLEEDEAITVPRVEPARPYRPLFRTFLEQGAIAVIVVIALGETGRAWGVDVAAPNNWWASLLDIALVVALGWIAYRAVCAFVERRLEDEGESPGASPEPGDEGGAGASRAATLLPIFRWVMVAVIVSVAVMIVLSELGIDIAPLIAGAGVIGIAVGFGAQKLIQDVFSGAFFLLDDAFRRGEYVEIEGVKGTVEKISIRSFQLRHHLGALHTLPFGEIRQLTNYSRDWVLMKLPLRVTYDTDVEKVRKLVKKLGQELLDHPEVGHTFLLPLKSQGVYKMEDSAMIIRVKFMTKPGEQFVTRKVVYAAIQELFARENIRFAHKEVTVRLADGDPNGLSEEQRKAVTAAAREVVDAEEAATAPELEVADR